jgi:hypothetical protein
MIIYSAIELDENLTIELSEQIKTPMLFQKR